MIEEKQNSYTECSYSKLESQEMHHSSTQLLNSCGYFLVKIFLKKKMIKKTVMILTLQTQITCLISDSGNPRMPNANASKTTELYDFLYGENVYEGHMNFS